jgi:hypothetical protein
MSIPYFRKIRRSKRAQNYGLSQLFRKNSKKYLNFLPSLRTYEIKLMRPKHTSISGSAANTIKILPDALPNQKLSKFSSDYLLRPFSISSTVHRRRSAYCTTNTHLREFNEKKRRTAITGCNKFELFYILQTFSQRL